MKYVHGLSKVVTDINNTEIATPILTWGVIVAIMGSNSNILC